MEIRDDDNLDANGLHRDLFGQKYVWPTTLVAYISWLFETEYNVFFPLHDIDDINTINLIII